MKSILIMLSLFSLNSYAFDCRSVETLTASGEYGTRALVDFEKIEKVGAVVKGCPVNILYTNEKGNGSKLLYLRTLVDNKCHYYSNLSTKLVCTK